MHINGQPYRSIWVEGRDITIIDQRSLPFELKTTVISSVEEMVAAIAEMYVRGAPLIGVSGAYGVCLAARECGQLSDLVDEKSLAHFNHCCDLVAAARPTAVNLDWAVTQARYLVTTDMTWQDAEQQLSEFAAKLADEDVAVSEAIGDAGLELIKTIANKKSGPVNILTHCNAGWLATIDYGTATAPMYKAKQAGIDIHVWVDETRPRLQGAKITAFELAQEQIAHTIIADSASGHLMQHGLVDICFVGTDRTTRNGDVANKIGTYPTALAAHDNQVPFYVCAPSSSIDWSLTDGMKIPIEERGADEVVLVSGTNSNGTVERVHIANPGSNGSNYAFDVTPARLVTGLVTERGLSDATEDALLALFPEHKPKE